VICLELTMCDEWWILVGADHPPIFTTHHTW
jgi:hypothetical protein